MSEDSGKAVSSALGVIPNAYFDLIARVMPGCLFLFALSQVSSKNVVELIMKVFIPYDELHGSTTAWLLVIVSASYILGHAFSPFIRFLEEGPQWTESIRNKVRTRKDKEKSAGQHSGFWEGLRYCYLPPFWSWPEAMETNRKKLHEDYNKLRLQSTSVAALAIRIRAEYTMYGGFAVAIAITLLVALIYALRSLVQGNFGSDLRELNLDQWLLLVTGILAVPTMLYRHLHTWDRFRKTVAHFLDQPAPAAAKQMASGQSA